MENFGFLNFLEELVDSDDSSEEEWENDLVLLDNNVHNCDLEPIPRVDRNYFLERVVHNFNDRQFQGTYRYVTLRLFSMILFR